MVATGFLSRRFESPGLCVLTETAATTTVMLPTAVTEAPRRENPGRETISKTADHQVERSGSQARYRNNGKHFVVRADRN
jgi:hypothetical protein